MAQHWDLDAAARATVRDGGYYSVVAAKGLVIVAPNTMCVLGVFKEVPALSLYPGGLDCDRL